MGFRHKRNFVMKIPARSPSFYFPFFLMDEPIQGCLRQSRERQLCPVEALLTCWNNWGRLGREGRGRLGLSSGSARVADWLCDFESAFPLSGLKVLCLHGTD